MSWMLPAAIFGGSMIAGGLNYAGASGSNKANRRLADKQMRFQRESTREQMEFQRDMSNTAYQRAMQDMEQAGLNPILAYSQGGAAVPGGASAAGASIAQQNELGPAVSSALDARRMYAELDNLKAQNAQIKSQAELNDALKRVAEMETQVKANTAKSLESQLPGLEAEKEIDESSYGKIMRYIQRLNPLNIFRGLGR